jgi:hypothetical protein
VKSTKSKTIPSSQSDVLLPEVPQEVNLLLKGQSRNRLTLTLEPGAEVDVTVTKVGPEGQVPVIENLSFSNSEQIKKNNRPFKFPLFSFIKRPRLINPSWQGWLIAAALVVYLCTRFINLDSYPIYFFTDEAVQTVLASDLVRDNFHNYTGELLPTYLENGGQYNLGTSVYLQILPVVVFGKSVWVTRGTSVLITLLAALAVGLTAKSIFKSRYAFAAILLLSITPAWFLHSRTAFETAMAVSFYTAFLYTYLKYQAGSSRYLIASVIFGVLCFYSYSPAQLVMAVTALALLISDWRTHLKNWKMILIGLGITAVCAVPYVRFLILHPDENIRHLQVLNSYWIKSIPFTTKLGIYFKEYIKLLNPLYWFIPNQVDLERHLMKNYGHLMLWTLPFFLLGLGITVRRIKLPQYRVLLIALLAAPTGAALAGAGITRALFMVIPAVLLTFLGLEQLLIWLERWKAPRAALVPILFAGLTVANGLITRDAVVNGPLWYHNYGLAGMQYGARQVFSEIRSMLNADPNLIIFLSPSWTNGTDILARYFFDDPVPFEMGSLDSYMIEKREISPDLVFVIMPEEMKNARDSGKFTDIQVIKTILFPDGEPGFFFIKMRYVDNIDEIFANEHQVRQQLIEKKLVTADGVNLTVRYPMLDMGTIQNIFDGDLNSLARTFEANPMRLQLMFAEPQIIQKITVRIGGTASTIDLIINPVDGSQAITLQQIIAESNDMRDIQFDLKTPVKAQSLFLTILNTYDREPSHVHVWEVSFK